MSETKKTPVAGQEKEKKQPLKTVFLSKKTSKEGNKNFYVAETAISGRAVSIVASPLKNGDVVLNFYDNSEGGL